VLVAKAGEIIYQASFGYADGTKKKLTPENKFDIGSVSKEFNGVAIQLLVQRGQVSLDDPLSKFFSQLPQWAQRVKIRHLITYTSGIPNFTPTSSEGDSLIMANLVSLKELSFEPGTNYIYNHYNVFLQMRVIEKVSAMRYADFIAQNLFKPAKMNGAIADLPIADSKMAKAFDQNFVETPYLQSMTGWVRLTAKDLFLWSEALHNFRILDKANLKLLATNFPGGESSLGTVRYNAGTLLWHRHQGSNSNYEALLYSDIKSKVTVVLMTNNQQMKVDGVKDAIFAVINNKAIIIPKKSFYLEIREKALANVEQGLAYYNELKANQKENYDFENEIADLITTGKYVQRRNKFADAIKIFQAALAAGGKPADLSYGYQLIGECYYKLADKTNARLNYQLAAKINPDNKIAANMLEQLDK
jgi:CubicO group peptidase (beta-lactamase class C family)